MRFNQLMPGIFVATLLIGGCVTEMSPDAYTVRVIQDPDEHNCIFKGMVTGSARFGWSTAHNAEGAFNDLMNEAVAKGANAIYINGSDTGVFGSSAVASAYRCEFKK